MTGSFKNLLSNRLFTNYLKVFTVDVLVKGTGIILLPLYLRLMTQDEFGMYGYLVAIIGTFALVFNLGIYVAQSKLYHDYADDKRGEVLYSLNIILAVCMGVLLAVVVLFDIDYLAIKFLIKNPLDYHKYRIPVLLGVTVSVYSLMLTNFFLTAGEIKKLQLFNIIRILLVNILVIGVLWMTTGDDAALTRLKYSNIIEFFILAAFYLYYLKQMKFAFNKNIALKALGISMPVLISAILGLFSNLSDRYFIDRFGSLQDLSVYNLALAIAAIIPFAFASFQNIWLPEVLKEKDPVHNRARSKKMFLRLFVILAMLSVGILVFVKMLFVTHVISPKYEAIMPLLPVVLLTSICVALTGMYSNQLIYLDKLYLIIWVGVPVAGLTVVLNLQLVPIFNLYGAALSSLIASLCYLASYSMLVSYFYNKTTKLYP